MKNEFEAKGVIWKDVTSYSRDDLNKIPTAYTANIRGTKITVTNGHIGHKPNFVYHCFSLGIDTRPLVADSHQEAAKLAYDKVKSVVIAMAKAFEII